MLLLPIEMLPVFIFGQTSVVILAFVAVTVSNAGATLSELRILFAMITLIYYPCISCTSGRLLFAIITLAYQSVSICLFLCILSVMFINF